MAYFTLDTSSEIVLSLTRSDMYDVYDIYWTCSTYPAQLSDGDGSGVVLGAPQTIRFLTLRKPNIRIRSRSSLYMLSEAGNDRNGSLT